MTVMWPYATQNNKGSNMAVKCIPFPIHLCETLPKFVEVDLGYGLETHTVDQFLTRYSRRHKLVSEIQKHGKDVCIRTPEEVLLRLARYLDIDKGLLNTNDLYIVTRKSFKS